jgi:hypothetical protein
VKFWLAAGKVAAPRVICALEASEPASKIAAVAESVTTSLRIGFLLWLLIWEGEIESHSRNTVATRLLGVVSWRKSS